MTRLWLMVFALAGFMATASLAQHPVITSFQGNGQLSWTNSINSNAFYRMEWASQAGGPWHSFTYQPINAIDAHSSTEFTVMVPMFYRVVMVTNEPPQGMVWIDGGDAVLGDTEGWGYPGEIPVHTNFVSGFWMDEMEVTKRKWDEVYNWAVTKGYKFDNVGVGKAKDHPVRSVNWYDCIKWCNARSQREGLKLCYYTDETFLVPYMTNSLNLRNNWVDWNANGYRLPTEAEWEKAARGARQGRLFPWGGDTIQHARANYQSNASDPYDTSPTRGFHPAYDDGVYPHTSPVGSFPANAYGLHDMAGNVREICWDKMDYYSAEYQTDPHGPEEGPAYFRMTRGGSCDLLAGESRCASRSTLFVQPGAVFESDIGFRCSRTH